MAILLSFALVLLLVVIAGFWRVFEKADEPGWKVLIPIYNAYILYKICWSPYAFLIICACSIVSYYYTPEDIVIGGIVSLLVGIITTVTTIIQCIKLSKSFGHGVFFGIGLFLLFPVFICILGFGNSYYEGTY